MSAEDLEQYESELELQLYREYKDVVGIFTYAVETERRFYLCNAVDLKVRTEGGDVYYEVSMGDAWVWDMYRPARFVKSAKVLTFRDVSIEEIAHSDLEVPKPTPDAVAAPTSSEALRAHPMNRPPARVERCACCHYGASSEWWIFHPDGCGRASAASPEISHDPRGKQMAQRHLAADHVVRDGRPCVVQRVAHGSHASATWRPRPGGLTTGRDDRTSLIQEKHRRQ